MQVSEELIAGLGAGLSQSPPEILDPFFHFLKTMYARLQHWRSSRTSRCGCNGQHHSRTLA